MGFVGILFRFHELLGIGPVDFNIRPSVPSLCCFCGLGCVGCCRGIVLIGADCERQIRMVHESWNAGILVQHAVSQGLR